MTTYFRAVLIFGVFGSLAFSADPAPRPSTENVETWIPPKYTKVVGYRHEHESGDGYFSLIRDGHLDTDRLAKISTGSATLIPEQVSKLTSALSSDRSYGYVACYDPHHVFVFYSDTGAVVAVIEICFKCRELHSIPPMPKSLVRHHDLISLAMLVDSLGLWQGKIPCEQWISKHDKHLKEWAARPK